MECHEVTTAQGEGQWGYHTYQVVLATVTRTYTDAADCNAKTVVTYEMRFPVDPGSPWDRRTFDSEKARKGLIDQSFSNLTLQESNIQRQCFHELHDIVSEHLSSVTFVMNYLQLGFNGRGLSVYVWPAVTIGTTTFRQQDNGYRDALCSLIGKQLQRVDEYLDAGLVLEFEGDSALRIPLGFDRHFPDPETVEYYGPNG